MAFKKRKQRVDLQKAILSTVAAAGILSAALLAPNVVGALGKMGLIPSPRHKDSIQRARANLVERGFLQWEGKQLRLTSAGERRLRLLELRNYQLPKPKHWDRRWRVLIFDIPESRKPLRNKIRQTLFAIGFVRLQDSVWVYPYDCEDLITLLKADFKVGKDMLYMIVDTIEYDKPLRNRFGLK